MARKYTRISEQEKLDAVQMYKDGLTQYEVADLVGVSQSSIKNWVKKYGDGYDRTHKGGAISRTMARKPTFKHEEVPEIKDQQNASSVVVERQVTVQGLGTSIQYIVKSNAKTVIFTKNGMNFEIEVDKITDFILELKGIQSNYTTLKANNEAW